MPETTQLSFTEDRVPIAGIEDAVTELVELYGGEITAEREGARQFTLPLRRGVATSGAVECTLSWAAGADETMLTLSCGRDIDAPRAQRIALLAAGVMGALLFTIWPFFAARREMGALAWIGGAVAIAVYLLTLRKSSGGIAADFLQRLARRLRG